jgi:hypothetical protein
MKVKQLEPCSAVRLLIRPRRLFNATPAKAAVIGLNGALCLRLEWLWHDERGFARPEVYCTTRLEWEVC